MDNNEDIVRALRLMQQQIDDLKSRRIYQSDIVPGVVQTRHFGSGNPYIVAGLEDALPDGATVTNSTMMYFATDTNTLYIYNGTDWVSVVLS